MPTTTDTRPTAADVRDSIAALVNYSWASEEADYCEQPPEDRDGHVFEHLQNIQHGLLHDPAGPTCVLVPVGILERAGQIADECADEACARQHGEREIALQDQFNRFARALYAAARGETVEWSNV